MHEAERHSLILGELADRRIATVAHLAELIGASEATIRRDINALDNADRLRRVRGGAEALQTYRAEPLAQRWVPNSKSANFAQKRAIARAAVDLCQDGESIIIHGDAITFQMVHSLVRRRMQILTDSFSVASHLLRNSNNTVMVPGGEIYREQQVILSPFENDTTANFYGRMLFLGAQGLGPLGVMEGDPVLIQAKRKLLDQADEVVLLVDSGKFMQRPSLLLCPLHRVHTIVTDDGVRPRDARLVQKSGVRLVVVSSESSPSRANRPARSS